MAVYDLGTITTGKVSLFKVSATSSVDNVVLSYAYKNGKLPPGLSVNPDGEIIGTCGDATFEMDNGETTFDQTTFTIDKKYTFTVEANGQFGNVSGTQQYSIDVVKGPIKNATNIYGTLRPDNQSLDDWQALVLNTKVFVNDTIYRANDENFSTTIPKFLFEFDLSAAMTAGMSTVIFTLLFIDFFDTAGTLTSVANVAGKVGKDGKVEDINKAMLSDSVGTVAGAMMGTTTVTSYVESGAGVKAGGKTGMTSLVIGLLFLACIFFAPLATSLPKQIDGAALLFVSVLFIRNITDIEWNDISESAPAILAMIAMPLTYSISNGIALAFVSYALIKIFTGKFSTTSPAIWVIAILSVVSFAVA